MTETPESTADEIPTDGVGAARVALGQAVGWTRMITAYLEAVVDIDRREVEDVTGQAHTFGTALTMRAQLATSLRVERFVGAYATADLAAEVLGKADVGGYRAGLRHFLTVATENEEAQKDMQAIFQGCHPRLLKEARNAALDVWEDPDHERSYLRDLWELEDPDKPPTHVLDLFETDAVLEALVPFFARFVTRTGQAINRLIGGETPPAATSPPSSPPSLSPPSES